MSEALVRLAAEDPSFRFSRDEESGQTVIEGMGELHLEIIVDRMRREFNVECNVGAPQVKKISQSPHPCSTLSHIATPPPPKKCHAARTPAFVFCSGKQCRSRFVLGREASLE